MEGGYMLGGFEAFLAAGGGTAGAGGLLFFAVVLILTGRLVTRSAALEIRKPYEAMAEQWKTAHDELLEVHRAQTEQLNQLMEMARASAKLLDALPLPRGDRSRGAEEGTRP